MNTPIARLVSALAALGALTLGILAIAPEARAEITEVLDSTCQTVAGRHIDVMADSKIPAGEEMVLKFAHART